jgi:predicted membrane channel-forming protein YqfA (hemolysin III family)
LNTKLYANSLIGVGVVSSLYHSSRGKLRKYLRWFDYTMIATATVVSCPNELLYIGTTILSRLQAHPVLNTYAKLECYLWK